MAAHLIESHRERAEVYTGADVCKRKSLELLEEISLPKGLLPLNDIQEVGYNRSTGFVWLKQRKPIHHRFVKIGKTVSYGAEVTAFVESRRMKRLTGVKSKEILIWITLNDIHIDDPASGKITFGTPAGISRSFPEFGKKPGHPRFLCWTLFPTSPRRINIKENSLQYYTAFPLKTFKEADKHSKL